MEDRDDSASRAALTNPLTGLPFSAKYFKIRKQREKLPAWGFLEKLEELLHKTNVVIIEGETGSYV